MSQPKTLKGPQMYRRSAWSRFTEGMRYGGGIGQWSWLIHRVTGLGILLFLIVHIIDTFLVVAYPAEYDFTVDIYGGVFWGTYYWLLRWGFRFAELGLIACVLFHAVNGVRIALFDLWPRSAEYQRQAFWVVLFIFGGVMIPVTYIVLAALAGPPGHAIR
jgi:succinate dehydrogenase / fumarate reductase, cytochrome b subunit